jgi:hypothetical protein
VLPEHLFIQNVFNKLIIGTIPLPAAMKKELLASTCIGKVKKRSADFEEYRPT